MRFKNTLWFFVKRFSRCYRLGLIMNFVFLSFKSDFFHLHWEKWMNEWMMKHVLQQNKQTRKFANTPFFLTSRCITKNNKTIPPKMTERNSPLKVWREASVSSEIRYKELITCNTCCIGVIPSKSLCRGSSIFTTFSLAVVVDVVCVVVVAPSFVASSIFKSANSYIEVIKKKNIKCKIRKNTWLYGHRSAV